MCQDGEVSFDEARLKAIVDRNNAHLAEVEKNYGGKEKTPVGAYPRAMEDHEGENPSRATIGRVLGPYELVRIDIPELGKKNVPAIKCLEVRYLGKENTIRVIDGRIHYVSVGINEDKEDLIEELSSVGEPAAPGARLLSRMRSKAPPYTPDRVASFNGFDIGETIPEQASSSVKKEYWASKGGSFSGPFYSVSEAKQFISEGGNKSLSRKRMGYKPPYKPDIVLRYKGCEIGETFENPASHSGKEYWVYEKGQLLDGSPFRSVSEAKSYIDETSGGQLSRMSAGVYSQKFKSHANGAERVTIGSNDAKAFFQDRDQAHEAAILLETDGAFSGVKVSETSTGGAELIAKFASVDGVRLSSQKSKGAKMPKLNKEKSNKKRLAKLVEARTNLKHLTTQLKEASTQLVASSNSIKLAAKKSKIDGELRGLMRLGKMTPAEFKNQNISDLASLDEKALKICLSAFSGREKMVIDPTQRGSTDALEAGTMAKEIGLKRLKAEARKDLKRFGAKLSADAEKEHEEDKEHLKHKLGAEAKQDLGSEDKDGAEYKAHMGNLKKHLAEGNLDEAKKAFGLAEKCGGEKHMSLGDAGAQEAGENYSKLQEQVDSLSTLVSKLAGEMDKVVHAEEAEGHTDLAAAGGEEEEEEEEHKPGSEA